MDDMTGKVVLVSGAARGQGRAHAVQFARLGASVIAFDIARSLDTVPYAMATADDLEETVQRVETAGGRIVADVADVRDTASIERVVAKGVEQFGRLDVVIANAGIVGHTGLAWDLDEDSFTDVIDTNLVGVWRTAKVAIPHLLAGEGDRLIVMTGSGMSVKGAAQISSYVAAKHGVIGLMRSLAKELAPHGVRVNAILPGNCHTPMLEAEALQRLYVPDVEHPTTEQFEHNARVGSPMNLPYVEPEDVAAAACWLASPSARYVTGVALPVDGGTAIP